MKILSLFKNLTGALFFSITVLGFLFKTMQWPGAAFLLMGGFTGIAFIYAPLYFIYRYKKETK